jgi:hypothetical protein
VSALSDDIRAFTSCEGELESESSAELFSPRARSDRHVRNSATPVR